jgi:hypothetical protein
MPEYEQINFAESAHNVLKKVGGAADIKVFGITTPAPSFATKQSQTLRRFSK